MKRSTLNSGRGALPTAAALAAGPFDDAENPLDAYEEGTVLDPEDVEVVELLREIDEWEKSHNAIRKDSPCWSR